MVKRSNHTFEPYTLNHILVIVKPQFQINQEIIALCKYFFSNTNIFFCSKIALFSHIIFICLEQKYQQNLFEKTVN